MTTALFGSSARPTSKNLVEFRAGKMYKRGKMLHPDKRKGQVYIFQSEDSLMHFCWKDRTSGNVEEDLIIFPDDCEYKRVTQCTTGRVYVLHFKLSSKRVFFWMQEPSNDKDDEYTRKVNEILNNPPTPGTQRSSGSTPSTGLGSDISNLRESDLQNLIGNFSQQQLMQILGSGVPHLATLLGPSSGSGSGSRGNSSSSASATTTSATSTTASSTTTVSASSGQTGSQDEGKSDSPSDGGESGPIKLSDLKSIFSGISVPTAESPRIAVDLSTAMTAEALQPLLTNEEFVNQLLPMLPQTGEELPSAELLRGTVMSPQFQQAISLFSSALQSGQLGPLINQFGLGDEAVLAASSCDMEAFIKALGKKKDEKEASKKEEKKEKDEDKDDDDSMAVD